MRRLFYGCFRRFDGSGSESQRGTELSRPPLNVFCAVGLGLWAVAISQQWVSGLNGFLR